MRYRFCISRLPRSSKGESERRQKYLSHIFVCDARVTNLSEKEFCGKGLDRGWWNRGVVWITSSSLPRLPCRTIYLLRRIYVGTKVKLACIPARVERSFCLVWCIPDRIYALNIEYLDFRSGQFPGPPIRPFARFFGQTLRSFRPSSPPSFF